jgi:hypothetical protein
MNVIDKNEFINAFTETPDCLTAAKLDVLQRIRQNLVEKLVEIDGKISSLRQAYSCENNNNELPPSF